MRKFILAAAAALFASAAVAEVPAPPRLLVVIAVDQFSTNLFEQYRPQFSRGFARLASGTVFRNARGSPNGLGAELKARWRGSRVVEVAGDRPAAKGPADQRWYWTGRTFETDLGARVPLVVPKADKAIAAALAQPRPALESPPLCAAKAPAGTRFARAAGDSAALAASPEVDGDTLALAAGLASELRLGRGAVPDLLTIRLSATGSIARTHGVTGEDMCLQLIELDREIGDFMSVLDSSGLDYAVALAGSGTAGPAPVLAWRKGASPTTVDAPVEVELTIAPMLGLPH
jgi:hypothetical protein